MPLRDPPPGERAYRGAAHDTSDPPFLVDRFGRIWEGRYGGVDRPVVGAHTLGFNDHAFAMSAIGNFDVRQPSRAMLEAYGALFAWKLSLHGVDAASTKQYVASRVVDTPAMDRLIEWLPAHMPDDDEAAIAHGDYRIGNLLFHPTEPRVAATPRFRAPDRPRGTRRTCRAGEQRRAVHDNADARSGFIVAHLGNHMLQEEKLAVGNARQAGPEPIHVVMRAGGGHVLHAAARGHERVLEDGVLARPPDRFVELRGEEAAYSHSSPPFFQM